MLGVETFVDYNSPVVFSHFHFLPFFLSFIGALLFAFLPLPNLLFRLFFNPTTQKMTTNNTPNEKSFEKFLQDLNEHLERGMKQIDNLKSNLDSQVVIKEAEKIVAEIVEEMSTLYNKTDMVNYLIIQNPFQTNILGSIRKLERATEQMSADEEFEFIVNEILVDGWEDMLIIKLQELLFANIPNDPEKFSKLWRLIYFLFDIIAKIYFIVSSLFHFARFIKNKKKEG